MLRKWLSRLWTGLTYDSGVLYDDFAAPQPRRSKMAKIKLELDSLDPDGLLGRAVAVKTALTGNATFASPNPTLTLLGNDITAAQTKVTAQKNAASR